MSIDVAVPGLAKDVEKKGFTRAKNYDIIISDTQFGQLMEKSAPAGLRRKSHGKVT
jgi:hypothetical protein